jgi:hypothetical protein
MTSHKRENSLSLLLRKKKKILLKKLIKTSNRDSLRKIRLNFGLLKENLSPSVEC